MTEAVQGDGSWGKKDAADVETLNLIEFWNVRQYERKEPRRDVKPYLWRWADLEPRLRRAAETVPIEDCERRALIFKNPGMKMPFMTTTLFGAYSLYRSGEEAPVHAHTPSASRFMVQGERAYTTVDGERCVMTRGDLVLTPSGAWHDHGNDGPDDVIWMDVLNIPLIEIMDASIFEFDYSEPGADGALVKRTTQSVTSPEDHSNNLYAAGGILPTFARDQRGRVPHTPMYVYRWENTKRTLERLARYQGSAFDGIQVEYVDPTNGRPVVPTTSFRAQMLRPGESTTEHRDTTSTVYCVLEGHGYTEIDGERFEWGRNDVFVLPNWRWHHHVNLDGDAPAFLYSVSDEPTLRKLGLHIEERRDRDGAVQRFYGGE